LSAMRDKSKVLEPNGIRSGYDPTKLFQRKVNKRALPDYYEVIKEPMALSEIKKKVAQQEYKSFPEFVRDFALIPHNAQVYNRQDSQAYVDALEVKKNRSSKS
jgi:chromatin structure-remodeling complex subunit RSC1/2